MQNSKCTKHKNYVLIIRTSSGSTQSYNRKPLSIHFTYDLVFRIKVTAIFTRDNYDLNSDRLLLMRPEGQTSALKVDRGASRGRCDWNAFDV